MPIRKVCPKIRAVLGDFLVPVPLPNIQVEASVKLVKFRTNSCPKFKLSELFVFYAVFFAALQSLFESNSKIIKNCPPGYLPHSPNFLFSYL